MRPHLTAPTGAPTRTACERTRRLPFSAHGLHVEAVAPVALRTRKVRRYGTAQQRMKMNGRQFGKTTARGESVKVMTAADFADSADPGVPAPMGLYDPALDKDSCGVGFIADIKGRKSHQIVQDALTILVNLEHRGAVGADPRAGDGAGILTQIPHAFFARKAKELGFTLPAPGEYAVGYLFLPRDAEWRDAIRKTYEDVAVAGARIGADRAAMFEIDQDGERILDDLLRLASLDVGDESDAA